MIDISKSDEYLREKLAEEHPSLISDVEKHFTHGPEVVTLSHLVWNYGEGPDFNEEGCL